MNFVHGTSPGVTIKRRICSREPERSFMRPMSSWEAGGVSALPPTGVAGIRMAGAEGARVLSVFVLAVGWVLRKLRSTLRSVLYTMSM
jgi:hypothetical protein